jgi:hypothetical protein
MPLSIEEKKSIIAYRVQKADSVFIEASDIIGMWLQIVCIMLSSTWLPHY